MGGLGSLLLAAFPDPATRPFAALGVDVQLFVGIPYPQHALSPGLVLAGDQWAMDRLQNGAAIHKSSGHSSNDQAGTSPDTKGAREGLLKREFHQPDCGHRTINSSGGGAVLTRFGFVFEHAVINKAPSQIHSAGTALGITLQAPAS